MFEVNDGQRLGMEDRQRIIDRISLLDMNQMRGIIPIVK